MKEHKKVQKDTCNTISLRLPDTLRKQVAIAANQCNMNQSQYIRKSLEATKINYDPNSPALVKNACNISTEINRIKLRFPAINLLDLEKGVADLCAILNL